MKHRLQLVDTECGMSARKQCDLLTVPRGQLYYRPLPESDENLRIMRLMDEHHLNHPTEGVLRMRDMLLALSIVANAKRVRRLLRLMGIMAIYATPHFPTTAVQK